MRKTIACMITVLLVCFCFMGCQNSESIQPTDSIKTENEIRYGATNRNIQRKLRNILTEKVNIISTDQEIKVETLKSVKDFNGEEYIVTECVPIGYTIYHPQSAKFIESSPSSPSPYKGLYGDLYYAGPTEYYTQKNGEYIHTVTGATIEPPDLEAYAVASAEVKEVLQQEADAEVLAYIENDEISQSPLQSRPLLATRAISNERFNWFANLDPCGYKYYFGSNEDDGYCGFIALNIIYAYFDKFIDDKFMDDKHWVDNTKSALRNANESFTEVLYKLDPKESTTSMHIDKVSKKYLAQKGITNCKHTDLYRPFFTKSTIKKKIDRGYPVIIFGNIRRSDKINEKKGGHAVVAYAYSGNDFTCHYGWPNYPQVTILGTFWSIYAMELK